MADVQALSLHRVPIAVVRVGDDRRELGDQVHGLAHLVVPGTGVRIRIKGIHLQHAAGEDVHDVGTFQVDDVHQRAVVQGHPGVQELGEGLQFLAVGQFAGQEQVGGLFITEAPPLFQDRLREILQLIAAVVQASVDGLQAAVLLTLVTHDVTDVGQTDQHTGTILVAESAFHAVALE